ncbi:hypothetical protein PRK78_002250 [Emydomyces testavorans]|uniref:Cell wall proline rich protein n=1 Tax=Emydomyces testavorans TaxID=2070801 RepID=A0AAF0DFS1_9EURO|nr:hypothetical protein PRK78_002250 [Emydomyces testavorans]
MASLSFAPPHSHWISASVSQNPYVERRNSAADTPVDSPFSFVPQDLQPRKPVPHKRAPPALPTFSFPQGPEPGPPSKPLVTSSQCSAESSQDGEKITGEDLATPPPLTMAVPPSLPTPGPGLSARGPGRRGHAHRRSAAISSVDLTAIAKAFPPKPVNGSAPSTPVDVKKSHFGNEDVPNLSSRSFPNMKTNCSPPPSPRKSDDRLRASSHSKPEPIETAAELHRPLSVVSSESSVSTICPKKSWPESTAPSTGTITPTSDSTTRPKTAGAKFDLSFTTLGGSNDDVTERPRTASASMVLSHDFSGEAPISSRNKRLLTTRHPLCNSILSEEIPPAPQRAPSSRKQNKKQKKMRSWAGILTRKGKKRTNKRPPSRKAPTPPPVLTRTNSAISSSYGVDFDEDNTIVIRTPTDPNAPRRSLPAALTDDPLTLDTSWKPQSFYEQGREPDMFSPVIDLDAALGPFNTPEMGPECPVSGFSAATRRMYSGGRRGEFVGPEMRYHRRAESAPEMPPFDRVGLNLGRYSTAAMLNPDVFDEKEEDDFLAETNKSGQTEDAPSAPRATQKAAADSGESSVKHSSASTIDYEISENNSGLGIKIVDIAEELMSSNSTTPQSVDSCQSTAVAATPSTPHLDISGLSRSTQREASPKDIVEILDTDDWPLQSEKLSTSISPPPSIRHEKHPSAPLDPSYNVSRVPLQLQSSMQAIDSAFPSPVPSTTSFDPPRLATPSSVTDRLTFSSVYSGEPGSECFHNSAEDVPSLTSSASTMTGTIPRLSSGFYPKATGDRSSSFGVLNRPRPTSSYTNKRSSLVSLSKLVGVASGEKSKLSHEQKAPVDDIDKKKKKKGNRISRLMQFWKSKEKENQKDTQA